MGGEIGVDSTPGLGSTFWFTVRLGNSAKAGADMQIGAHAGNAEHRLEQGYQGARLLLVEDDPTNQEVALGLLRSVGLVAELAVDGVYAVEMVGQNDYELVLMDVQMPRMDGLEATRRIRQLPQCQQMPILAMTANAFAEDRDNCMAAGMNGFVAKPVDPEELFTILIKWLKPREPAAPSVATVAPVMVQHDQGLMARLETIDGLDLAKGLSVLRGDAPTFARLLCQFAERHRSDMFQIAGLDQESARRVAHTLKGSAATLGLIHLSASAALLEAALRQSKSQTEAAGLVEACGKELETLNKQLAELELEAHPLAPTVDAAPEEVKAILKQMEELLSFGDVDAGDLFLNSSGILRHALGDEVTTQLGRQIDEFDFLAALETLKAANQ
jgi:CheY-like chemotaxis protein